MQIIREKLLDQSEQNKKLKSSLQRLIGWTINGACSDCEMFRRAPSDIEWIHFIDCAHLEVINEACNLLGIKKFEGHCWDNPKEEMHRLAQERAERCKE